MRLNIRQYAQALLSVSQGKTRLELAALADGFLALLRTRGDWKKARAIADCFGRLFDEQAGQVQASVIFAVPPTAAELKKITGHLAKALGRKIILTEDVQPQIVGGAVLRYGDKVLDLSARRAIADLRDAISS